MKKYILRLLKDYEFRTFQFSLFSFILDIGLFVFYIIMSQIQHSEWYSCLIIYYLIVFALKAMILFLSKKNANKENKEYISKKCFKACGITFIILPLVLSAMIFQIVSANKVFYYPIFMIYIIAGYTLFRIVMAIYNFFKVQQKFDYHIRSLKNINLVSAFISFLSLQTMALDTFSSNVNKQVFNAVTGAIVCVLILATGIYMLVHSHKSKWFYGDKF